MCSLSTLSNPPPLLHITVRGSMFRPCQWGGERKEEAGGRDGEAGRRQMMRGRRGETGGDEGPGWGWRERPLFLSTLLYRSLGVHFTLNFSSNPVSYFLSAKRRNGRNKRHIHGLKKLPKSSPKAGWLGLGQQASQEEKKRKARRRLRRRRWRRRRRGSESRMVQ